MPAPAIVKDKHAKDMLDDDPIIKWVLEKAVESNITFFSINHPVTNAYLVNNGYFTHNEKIKILEDGAVGEIFGHYINSSGDIHDTTLENRVIGMDISELREKDYSVCLSTAQHLIDTLHAAIVGKYFNAY